MFHYKTSLCFSTLLKFFCLMSLFLSASGETLSSQNNPYKINDKLYPDFVRLQQLGSSPTCLQLTDSLYAEAVKLGDKKAQVAILCTPLQYAAVTSNSKLMDKYVVKVQTEATKYNYPQYYFYAYKQQALLYLNNNDFSHTKQVLEKMEDDAKTKFNGYGKFMCYQLYGNYYRVLKNETEAIKYYVMALDLAKREHPDQDNESIYTNLAVSYRYNGQIDLALKTIDEGLANLKDRNIISREFRLLDAKCFTLFYAKRYEEAEKVYKQLCDPKFNKLRARTQSYFTSIYHYIYIGEYEKALTETKKIPETYVRYTWLSLVESARGNKDLALQYYMTAYELMQRTQIERRQQDFARAYAEIGNHILENQNTELQLKSSELALHNSQLALEKQRNLAKMQQLVSDKSRLALANKELSYEKLRTTMKEQRVQQQLHETELKRQAQISRTRSTIATLAFLFATIIILWLASFLYTRHRSLKNMAKKNEELSKALHRAEESEQTKMRFLQNMSHEIRTPLNAIVGFSQLLAHQQDTDDFTEEQRQEFINLVDQNTETLTTLIDDILSLSAMEHGTTMKLSFTKCFVNSICHNSLQSVKHRCPEGVRLYYTTEVEDDFYVICDSHRLQQVLTNFLTNAEKHTESGEIHLHASLSENPGNITFSVTDTGEGVPKEMAESIFNRFEKLDSFVQGTGLGLNICRMIASHLHAVVKLDITHEGPGARFVFILPLEQPEANLQQQPAQPSN